MDTAEGLRPEAVEQIDFATVRRGYEPDRVRSRLQEAAAEIRRLNTVVQELSERLSHLESTPPERLEEARLSEVLGDEALKVLQAARDAASERIGRAERECVEIVERGHAAAAAIVEEGRNNGRHLVQQARGVRERMLADLAGKRKLHRREVEQLRTIRDRLLESLTICQQGLSGWVEELVQVVPQARAAAERAGLLIEAERETTVEEIEAEIEAGRLMGLPLDRSTTDSLNAADDSGWDARTGEEWTGEQDGRDGGEPGAEVSEKSGEASEQPAEPASVTGVGLYDMEAEALSDIETRSGTGLLARPAPLGAAWTPPPVSAAGEPVATAAVGTGGIVEDAGESGEPAVSDMVGSGEPVEPGAEIAGEFVGPAAGDVADAGEFDELLEEDLDEPVEPAAASLAVPEAGSGQAAPPASGAGAIFARLRAVGVSTVEGSTVGVSTVETATAPADAERASGSDAKAALSSEPPQEPEAGADAEPRTPAAPRAAHSPDDAADPLVAARKMAVGEIASALKLLVVDEQGELLDALRRTGPRALEAPPSVVARSYARAVREPLEDFASYIDISIDDIDVAAAGKAVVSLLVEPVRARLAELARETDDIGGLIAAVRAMYRESRDTRADEAAAEAFARGWPHSTA